MVTTGVHTCHPTVYESERVCEYLRKSTQLQASTSVRMCVSVCVCMSKSKCVCVCVCVCVGGGGYPVRTHQLELSANYSHCSLPVSTQTHKSKSDRWVLNFTYFTLYYIKRVD